jgi:hypothetical protein
VIRHLLICTIQMTLSSTCLKYAFLALFMSASTSFATPPAFVAGQFGRPVSDDAGGRLLLSSSGQVTAYDNSTGALLEATFATGMALDILTADSFSPAGSTSAWLSIHDLQTRERVDYEIPNTSFERIVSAAYADDHTLLFTTHLTSASGGTELRRLDLRTGAVTFPLPYDEYGISFLGAAVTANADRSVVSIFDPSYWGAFFLRGANLSGAPADHDAAWNRDGTLLATASNSGLDLYDSSLSKIGSIPRIDSDDVPASVVYSPVSDVLYVSTFSLKNHLGFPNKVIAYDASSLASLGTIAILPEGNYHTLSISGDGRRLFAQQFDSSPFFPINGVRIFDVSAFTVPEPGSLVGLCCAMVLAQLSRRRR